MIIKYAEQNSEEWFDLKRGVPSSSNFDKIVQINGKPSKQRDKYLYRLAGERVSDEREETYSNSAMERGIALEPKARLLYEFNKGIEVKQVGVCYKDAQKSFLCSPDGLVGKDGGLEIKCPSMAVHVGYLEDNTLPTAYFQQVHGSLYITGRKWWDFMSYYPGIKPFIIRIKRDEVFVRLLEKELDLFVKDLGAVEERIK